MTNIVTRHPGKQRARSGDPINHYKISDFRFTGLDTSASIGNQIPPRY